MRRAQRIPPPARAASQTILANLQCTSRVVRQSSGLLRRGKSESLHRSAATLAAACIAPDAEADCPAMISFCSKPRRWLVAVKHCQPACSNALAAASRTHVSRHSLRRCQLLCLNSFMENQLRPMVMMKTGTVSGTNR